MLSGITDVLTKCCGTKRPVQSWKDKDLFKVYSSLFGNPFHTLPEFSTALQNEVTSAPDVFPTWTLGGPRGKDNCMTAKMQCHLSFSLPVLSTEVVWLSLWINQQMTHHGGGPFEHILFCLLFTQSHCLWAKILITMTVNCAEDT